jgi:hypothetical protein
MEAKEMDIGNTKSLVDFSKLLENLVKDYPGNLLAINNKKKDAAGESWYGKHVEYKKRGKDILFWIGIYFDDPRKDPYVCIQNPSGAGTAKGKYFYTLEDDSEWVYLNPDLNERLNKKTNIDEQEKIIKDFLDEYIEML